MVEEIVHYLRVYLNLL
jgi:hypothetical protein